MKKSWLTKTLSILLTAMLIILPFSASFTAYAQDLPSTSITSLTAKAAGFKIKYKKASKITGYQIQYSTKSSMSSAKSVRVTKASTVSQTISKLNGKQKYYVRVRTYKKSGSKTAYSAWSSKKSVTTKQAPAMKIQSCKAVSGGFYLAWKELDDTGTVTYTIQYSTSKNFSSNVRTKTVTSTYSKSYSSYTVYQSNSSKSIESGTYYVRIKGKYSNGSQTSWSEIKKVKITNYQTDLEEYAGI